MPKGIQYKVQNSFFTQKSLAENTCEANYYLNMERMKGIEPSYQAWEVFPSYHGI